MKKIICLWLYNLKEVGEGVGEVLVSLDPEEAGVGVCSAGNLDQVAV